MISKELLSKITTDEVTDCNILDNTVVYLTPTKFCEQKINIYELIHKCKEWALKLNYSIEIRPYNDYGDTDWHIVVHFNNKENLFDLFDTEPEAIFKACEWILNEM